MLTPYQTRGPAQPPSRTLSPSLRFAGVYPTKEMMDQAEKGASYTKIEDREGRVAYITDHELNVRTQLWKTTKDKQNNLDLSGILTEFWHLVIKNKNKQPNWSLNNPALMQFWKTLVDKRNNEQTVEPAEAQDYLSQYEDLLIEHASAIADKSVKSLD